MTPVSHGKPCAGNPHARFDEGASAPETPRRKALLHKNLIGPLTVVWISMFTVLGAAAAGAAVDPVAATAPKAYTNAAGKVLLYRVMGPAKMESGRKYPLVVFMHGAGERGNDNAAQLKNATRFILAYMREKGADGYFLAAQCPSGQQWVDTPWGNLAHRMNEKPSESMGLLLELVGKMRMLPSVDASRVYVTGLSMGGYGTWDAVQRHPDWFAAALPCCGGGDTTLAWKIRDVPIWTFHGAKDQTVPVTRSRDMVSALWAVGGNIRYREYPDLSHGCWDRTYSDEAVLKWLFSQRKK